MRYQARHGFRVAADDDPLAAFLDLGEERRELRLASRTLTDFILG
jgi:hypothetical protein